MNRLVCILLIVWWHNPGTIYCQYSSGFFDYSVDQGAATITGTNYAGFYYLGIPDQLDGIPVTGITADAFNSKETLLLVTIPSTIAYIGERAFSGCTNLQAFSVEASSTHFTAVDGILFSKDMTELVKLPPTKTGSYVIPASVKTIGDGAFEDCSLVESITIPEGVVTIGNAAFANCIQIDAIYIPAGVTAIGETPFYGCTSLQQIDVSENNSFYADSGGALFNKSITELIQFPRGLDYDDTFTLPSTVTTIGVGAFAGSNRSAITFPASVTTIKERAFENCFRLLSLPLTENLTTIEAFAIYGCSNIYVVGITIPSSVESIGDGAFNNCNKVTTVAIGSGVANMGDEVFANLPRLESIDVDPINSLLASDDDGVLYSKDFSQLLVVPPTKTGDFIIPETVEIIGPSAFYGCRNLTSVTLPSGLLHIGKRAFESCYQIQEAILPDGLVSIADYAYSACSNLNTVSVPASVTSIGRGAFSRCGKLASLQVNPLNNSYVSNENVLYTKDFKTILQCAPMKEGLYEMNSLVETIGYGAFEGCYKLTGINLPESVTKIEDKAFSSCNGLQSITLPSGLEKIGNYAFGSCTSLVSVTIPASVKSIGSSCFDYCSYLLAVNVDSNNPYYCSVDGVLFNKDKSLLVTYPSGKGGNYDLPYGVVSISPGAFQNIFGLTSISFPETVLIIAGDAFSGCYDLYQYYFFGSPPAVFGFAFFQVGMNYGDGMAYYVEGAPGWQDWYHDLRTEPFEDSMWYMTTDELGGWSYLDWFGWFVESDLNWIYHPVLEWCHIQGDNTYDFYIYGAASTFHYWTSDEIYPYVYVFDPINEWRLLE